MDLKSFREINGLSQEELASALGCSARSVSRWEAGQPLSRLAIRNLEFLQERFPVNQAKAKPRR